MLNLVVGAAFAAVLISKWAFFAKARSGRN